MFCKRSLIGQCSVHQGLRAWIHLGSSLLPPPYNGFSTALSPAPGTPSSAWFLLPHLYPLTTTTLCSQQKPGYLRVEVRHVHGVLRRAWWWLPCPQCSTVVYLLSSQVEALVLLGQAHYPPWSIHQVFWAEI